MTFNCTVRRKELYTVLTGTVARPGQIRLTSCG